MVKQHIDLIILDFLRRNPKGYFKIEDLRELINRSLRIKHIRQALGRLRKKNLVSRKIYPSGRRRYWIAKNKRIENV